MTEQELAVVRQNMRILVLQMLVRALYTSLARTSPTAAQALRDQFSALRQDHGKIAVPNLREGYSDLVAAEYQEALDDTLKFIETGI